MHPNQRLLGPRWPRPYLAGMTRAAIAASLGGASTTGRPLEYPARLRVGPPLEVFDSVVFDRGGAYLGMLRYRDRDHWDWCYPGVVGANENRNRVHDWGNPRARRLNAAAFVPAAVNNVLDRWINEFGSGNFPPPPPPPPPGGAGV